MQVSGNCNSEEYTEAIKKLLEKRLKEFGELLFGSVHELHPGKLNHHHSTDKHRPELNAIGHKLCKKIIELNGSEK
jgi:hypothetical protein